MEDSSDGISTSSHHSFLHAVLPAATYRPIVIFCIGIWGWGLNLYLLNKHHIDTNTLLQIHSVDNKHAQPLYRSVLMLALYLTTLIGLNMFAYWFTVDPASPSSWLPVSCYLTAMGLVLWPGKSLYRKERVRFLRWARLDIVCPLRRSKRSFRVLRRLFSFSNVHFADVIMADILTSFSNVFGDLFTTGCSVLVRSDSEDACHRDLFVPLLIRWYASALLTAIILIRAEFLVVYRTLYDYDNVSLNTLTAADAQDDTCGTRSSTLRHFQSLSCLRHRKGQIAMWQPRDLYPAHGGSAILICFDYGK